MQKRLSCSHEQQSLSDVAAHREDMKQALQRFYSAQLGDARMELESRLVELDRAWCLQLLAAVEAAFRVDYLQRCYHRGKDDVSKAFRTIYRAKEIRADLANDILKTWRAHAPMVSSAVSDLIGAYNYRHWLAHGRYWVPKLGRDYDFDTIYSLVEPLLDDLPLVGS